MGFNFAYDAAGSKCSGVCQPGAKALMSWARKRYDLPLIGCYNCRNSRAGASLSLHGEGRADDLHVHTRASTAPPTPAERAKGDRIAADMVAKAEAIGVQRVIWLDKEWDSRPGERQWEDYGGPFHGNHLHVELCWAAARTLTVAMLDAAFSDEEDDVAKVWVMGTKDGEPLYVVSADLTQKRKIETPAEEADLRTLWKEAGVEVLGKPGSDGAVPRYVSAALLQRIPG